MENKACENCGNKLIPSYKVCIRCGKAVNVAEQEQVVNSLEQQLEKNNEMNKNVRFAFLGTIVSHIPIVRYFLKREDRELFTFKRVFSYLLIRLLIVSLIYIGFVTFLNYKKEKSLESNNFVINEGTKENPSYKCLNKAKCRALISRVEEAAEQTSFGENLLVTLFVKQGFTEDAVRYAIINSSIDWNAKALEAGLKIANEDFLSESKLEYFLYYSGYNKQQVEYSLNNVNLDWKDQAKKNALKIGVSNHNKETMVTALLKEGFTEEEAIYGAEANGLQ